MTHQPIENVNVIANDILITPGELKSKLPISAAAAKTIKSGRETIQNILDRKDSRIIVVVGPCSIHDIDAAKEYAHRLAELAEDPKNKGNY